MEKRTEGGTLGMGLHLGQVSSNLANEQHLGGRAQLLYIN